MAISLVDMQVRYSGGTANTSQSASLGGLMSTAGSSKVLSQTATRSVSNIGGLTLDDAAGNAIGNGTLTYTNTGQTLQWTPPGGSIGAAVAIGTNGTYCIIGGGTHGAYIIVTVVSASLPGSNQTDTVVIANRVNQTFSDLSKNDSYVGKTDYRCFYIKNNHATDSALDVGIWINSLTSGADEIHIGLDPVGVGTSETKSVTGITRTGSTATATCTAHGWANGESIVHAGADQAEYNGTFTISNVAANTYDFTVSGTPATPATGTITASSGVAQTIGSETTAPTGVTFTQPTSDATALSIGTITAGRSKAFWIKRVVASATYTKDLADKSMIAWKSAL